jgi:hypothetical protein
MKLRLVVLCFALLGKVPSSAQAQERPTVAVLPLTFLHLPGLDAKTETERVRGVYAATGKFHLLSEPEIHARLARAGVKDERCHEVECAVEFGAALGVQKVFTAQVLQLGRRSLVRVRYVDVQAAKAELAESIELVGETVQLRGVLDEVLARVLSPGVRAPTIARPVFHAFEGPRDPFYKRPWFLITLGAVISAGTAAGLVLGLRSTGPGTGGATFNFLGVR